MSTAQLAGLMMLGSGAVGLRDPGWQPRPGARYAKLMIQHFRIAIVAAALFSTHALAAADPSVVYLRDATDALCRIDELSVAPDGRTLLLFQDAPGGGIESLAGVVSALVPLSTEGVPDWAEAIHPSAIAGIKSFGWNPDGITFVVGDRTSKAGYLQHFVREAGTGAWTVEARYPFQPTAAAVELPALSEASNLPKVAANLSRTIRDVNDTGLMPWRYLVGVSGDVVAITQRDSDLAAIAHLAGRDQVLGTTPWLAESRFALAGGDVRPQGRRNRARVARQAHTARGRERARVLSTVTTTDGARTYRLIEFGRRRGVEVSERPTGATTFQALPCAESLAPDYVSADLEEWGTPWRPLPALIFRSGGRAGLVVFLQGGPTRDFPGGALPALLSVYLEAGYDVAMVGYSGSTVRAGLAERLAANPTRSIELDSRQILKTVQARHRRYRRVGLHVESFGAQFLSQDLLQPEVLDFLVAGEPWFHLRSPEATRTAEAGAYQRRFEGVVFGLPDQAARDRFEAWQAQRFISLNSTGIPALLIAGDNDQMAPLADVPAGLFVAVNQRLIIEGAGHNATQVDVAGERLAKFLKDLPPVGKD